MTVLFTPTPTNHASAQEFDDGDAPEATIINPLGEAAFNTAKWAANRVGTYRFIAIYEYVFDDDTAPYQFNSWTTDAFADPAAGGVVTCTAALNNDVVICHAHGVAELDTIAAEWGELRLLQKSFGVGATTVPAARTMLQLPANKYYPFAIHGKGLVTADGAYTVTLQGKMSAVGAGQTLRVQSVLKMTCELWRPNT